MYVIIKDSKFITDTSCFGDDSVAYSYGVDGGVIFNTLENAKDFIREYSLIDHTIAKIILQICD